jgi:hypothetical protein
MLHLVGGVYEVALVRNGGNIIDEYIRKAKG